MAATADAHPDRAQPLFKNRLPTLDYLRGIAALMVCACHFSDGLPRYAGAPLHDFGPLGVQVFFVISGFIIPYGLERARYTPRSLLRFLAKRLLRLHPPFVCAMVVTVAFSMAASRIKNEPFMVNPSEMFGWFFYRSIPSENPVIWSLVVELKYYFFIGLTYPVFFSKTRWVRWSGFTVAALVSATLAGSLEVLRYLPYFLIGFAVCLDHLGLTSKREAAGLGLLAVAAAMPTAWSAEIIAAVVAALAIVYLPAFNFRAGAFFGAISYSLYLIHFPVGVKFLNLTLPKIHSPAALTTIFGMMLLAAALSTAAAWLLYLVAEKPSIAWSKAVKLSPRRPLALAAPETA